LWAVTTEATNANDPSMVTFAQALRDPIDFVRNAALHSVACESCKVEGLCVADVVEALIEVVAGDPNPELRTKAIPMLMRLSDRDDRARVAIERAAAKDPDELIRRAADDTLWPGTSSHLVSVTNAVSAATLDPRGRSAGPSNLRRGSVRWPVT
jgi:hypothetical protein